MLLAEMLRGEDVFVCCQEYLKICQNLLPAHLDLSESLQAFCINLRLTNPSYLVLHLYSVTNSSDGLIFVKRRAKDGRFFSKNTGVRRAKRRAKFKLCIKKARKFDSRHFNNKSA